MVKANRAWTVLPHLPVERLEDNLWRVQGSLAGMALKRVMTLARLAGGEVVVHSAIALDEPSTAALEAWGRPTFLLVPNRFHRLDAPAWVERYPDLKVLCPRGGRRWVEEVVRVDGDYDDFPADDAVSLTHLDGTALGEGAMIVRSAAGTSLVLNDAVFNMPHGSGLAGFFFRHVTASTGGPRVSRLFRLFAVKDRVAFADHLERLAATPGLVRVVVSHHRVIDQDPAGVLRAIAASLRG